MEVWSYDACEDCKKDNDNSPCVSRGVCHLIEDTPLEHCKGYLPSYILNSGLMDIITVAKEIIGLSTKGYKLTPGTDAMNWYENEKELPCTKTDFYSVFADIYADSVNEHMRSMRPSK